MVELSTGDVISSLERSLAAEVECPPLFIGQPTTLITIEWYEKDWKYVRKFPDVHLLKKSDLLVNRLSIRMSGTVAFHGRPPASRDENVAVC